MKGKCSVIQFLCFMILVFLSSQLSAFMKGLSTEELTKESEIVVIGEVLDVQSHWSSDGTTIISNASLFVYETVRGRTTQQVIVVEYEGGEVGDIGLKVSDVVPLTKGEKVLLFLKSGKSKKDGDIHTMVGKAQGKYTIGDDGLARKGGFSLVDRKDILDNDIHVDVLKEKIRRVK